MKTDLIPIFAKTAGLTVALGMVLNGILCFALPTCGHGVNGIIRNIHKIVFGLLIVLTELGVNVFRFLDYMEALRSYFGRGCIYLLIGTLVISNKVWYQVLVYVAVIVLGFINVTLGLTGFDPRPHDKEIHQPLNA